MRQLHTARERQCDVQSIVTKDAARSNSHDGTPAMPPSQNGVSSGVAHLGRWIPIKRGDEKVLNHSAHVGFFDCEVLKFDYGPLPPGMGA